MMKGTFGAVVGVLMMAAASHAQAANKLIAVLPLDVGMTKGKMDKEGRASIEEMLRDVATDALAPAGWTILTGDTTLQVLRDNGVKAEECGNQECHLANARELKADKFISGAVQFVEGEFTASIRLIDTTTGKILASERLRGKTVKSLTTTFEGKAADFFKKGGLIDETKPKSPALNTTSGTATIAIPAVVTGEAFKAAGLEWQYSHRKKALSWANAKEYCSQLSLSGTGWRLPTKDELLALQSAAQLSDEVEHILNLSGKGWYWSSTEYESCCAWGVPFGQGHIGWMSRSATEEVRCVR